MPASIKNPILVIVKNVGALTAANLLGRLLNMVIVAVVAIPLQVLPLERVSVPFVPGYGLG